MDILKHWTINENVVCTEENYRWRFLEACFELLQHSHYPYIPDRDLWISFYLFKLETALTEIFRRRWFTTCHKRHYKKKNLKNNRMNVHFLNEWHETCIELKGFYVDKECCLSVVWRHLKWFSVNLTRTK